MVPEQRYRAVSVFPESTERIEVLILDDRALFTRDK